MSRFTLHYLRDEPLQRKEKRNTASLNYFLYLETASNILDVKAELWKYFFRNQIG